MPTDGERRARTLDDGDARLALAAQRPRVHAAAEAEWGRGIAMRTLPQEGLVAIVKRDCPTCVLAAPVLGELARRAGITVYSQDDPGFPDTVKEPIDDSALDISHRLKIEVVPTLIRLENGREVARTYGWDRGEWERLSGLAGLGHDLPESRPGCGARNIEPGVLERLKVRFNETGLKARRIAIGDGEDEQEAMFARGWSDGLPLVAPTEERVLGGGRIWG